MNSSLLRWLHCPFCEGNLHASETTPSTGELGYGVLSCYCGCYPVVAGIPVFKKGVPIVTEVVALIKARHYREALLALISPPNPTLAPLWMKSLPLARVGQWLRRLVHERTLREWQDQAASLLMDNGQRAAACDLFIHYFHNKENFNYFGYRFGQPRHLVALSYASLVHRAKKPILDLACGSGHITRTLVRRAEGQLVVGVDDFFLMLYTAKRWIAPEAEYVCCAADAALPFSDGAFSAVFCSDAFHLFANKANGAREVKRLIQNEGLLILVGLRNALLQHLAPGQPLPPKGYLALVADMPHCLVADSDVLVRYLQKQGPPLAHSASAERLASEPLLSIVASHRQEVFRDYGSFEEWPHAEGRLGLNPLYVKEGEDGSAVVRLRRTFPSAFYEKENAECKEYLPETVEAPSRMLTDLSCGSRTPEMQRLIEQCVVLGMPEQFR